MEGYNAEKVFQTAERQRIVKELFVIGAIDRATLLEEFFPPEKVTTILQRLEQGTAC